MASYIIWEYLAQAAASRIGRHWSHVSAKQGLDADPRKEAANNLFHLITMNFKVITIKAVDKA
jgi:hypothetical protein